MVATPISNATFRQAFTGARYIRFVNNVLPNRAFPAPIVNMAKTPIIIDCDPGIDDAVALALAFSARDELEILAVTTVAGNVPLELTARNARIMRQLAGREDVPVYAGCAQPLIRALESATEFHGKTGLEGIEIFNPIAPLGGGHAAIRIASLIRASSEPVKLIATGPLTNIGLALALAPEIAGNIAELVIMGGADSEGGNITETAEYNFWADPHAAKLVFGTQYDVPITLFSLDFTHTVRIHPEDIAAMRASGGRLSDHAANLMVAINKFEKEHAGSDTGPLHDPCTIIHALAPELAGARTGGVKINTDDGALFGQSVFIEGNKGARWAINNSGEATRKAVFKLLTDRIGAYV